MGTKDLLLVQVGVTVDISVGPVLKEGLCVGVSVGVTVGDSLGASVGNIEGESADG